MSLEARLRQAVKLANIDMIHSVFSDIYESYSKLIYFTVVQIVNNNKDAEEIVQDVFISFYNNINKNEINNIKYYLIVSGKNKAINYLKKKKEEVLLDENTVFNVLDSKVNDYSLIIDKMKLYLSDTEIEILISHILYEETFKDIAIKLNKKLNTVLSIYHRGIKKFKKRSDKNEN